MIILGIDPGLGNTGWGLVEVDGNRYRCLGYGCITTPSSIERAERLQAIHDGLAELVSRYAPAEAGIENVYFGINAQTAMGTGEARGAAFVALAAAGMSVGEYPPAEIKLSVVGSGNADKRQVAYMVRAILGLDAEPKPEHAADALAVAICHANCRVARAREKAAQAQASKARAAR